MVYNQATALISKYTQHKQVAITCRGNLAIKTALKNLRENDLVLIPEEGGWLSYKTLPKELHLRIKEVQCKRALLDLDHLQELLEEEEPKALLYENPGGYTVAEPANEIYDLCHKHNCLVIMDVSGSIGTPLCDGSIADICVASFRNWKLVDAGVGGFISSNKKEHLVSAEVHKTPKDIENILNHLRKLPERIQFLTRLKEKIKLGLADFSLLGAQDPTPGLIVLYTTPEEKEKILNYCKSNQLEWTQCPRYIRVNELAISIEIKRKNDNHKPN